MYIADFFLLVVSINFFVIGIYSLQSVCTFGYISLLSIVGERCAVRLRTKLFKCLIEQDISFFDNHRTGELVNRY